MALVICGYCGHRISSRAKSCPKCAGAQGEGRAPEISAADAREAGALVEDAPRAVEESLAGAMVPAGNDKPAKATQEPVELPASRPPKPAEQWYYIAGAVRLGPVEFAILKKLVDEGQLGADTQVWKAGLPDWVKFSGYQETAEDEGAPTAPAAPVSSPWIWALAVAPLWGGLLQIVATEIKVAVTGKPLTYYSQLWWIVVLCNLLFCVLDYRNFARSGRPMETINKWLCLLVPLYIFRRDRIAGAKVNRVAIWAASSGLTVALFVYLNGMYSQLLSK